jgi:cysteine desulfurase / selenocysteine lyase
VHQFAELIKTEFPQDESLIYMNHAAVSPWPLRTSITVNKFARENVELGAKFYSNWVDQEQKLKQQIQELINAPSMDDIALLKNTSEALSIVACGINWKKGENIVSTDQEFPSNRIVWQAQQKHGVEFREVEIVSANDPEQALMDACNEKTRVLTVSSVQYGSGFRLDLPRLGRHCRDNEILYCVDAIQSIGAHSFDVQEINADFAMADGHKWMMGPEGIALFYCREALRDQLELHQYGWHMVEDYKNYNTRTWKTATSCRRFECGSPNMLGIHALSASLSLLLEIGIDAIESMLLEQTDYLTRQLSNMDRVRLISPMDRKQRAGIVTCKIEGVDMASYHRLLLSKNVICAHRLDGIRFSPHFYTGLAKINNLLEILSITI